MIGTTDKGPPTKSRPTSVSSLLAVSKDVELALQALRKIERFKSARAALRVADAIELLRSAVMKIMEAVEHERMIDDGHGA